MIGPRSAPDSRRSRPGVSRASALALLLGYLGLAVGTILARRAPATRYESSIYEATPLPFWIAVAGALILATVLAVGTRSRRTRGLALGLGGLAIVATLSLPIVRGYFFLGESDALTHLGTARDIAASTMSPFEVLYPAIHLLGVALRMVAGIDLELAMLLVVSTFAAAFLVFVPLTVRIVDRDDRTVVIAALAGMCLLPINWISVLLMAHPSSMAILFFPVFAATAALVLRDPRFSTGILIVLVAVTYVIVHPMHAVNIAAMVGAVIGVVALQRRTVLRAINPGRVTMLATAGALGIALVVWLRVAAPAEINRFARTVVIATIRGDPADALLYQLEALTTIGADPALVFLKLFLVPFLFCCIAGLTMARALYAQWRTGGLPSDLSGAAVACLSIGFVPVVGLFFVYFFASLEPFEFRQVGFAMSIVTIVGAIGIGRLDRRLVGQLSRSAANGALAVVFVAFLLASLLIVFPSPYIYLPMGHVTDAQVSGYETTFEFRQEPTPIAYVRSDPGRYSDAIHGASAFERYDFYGGELDRMAPDHFAGQNLPGHYDEPHYLAVTAADRERDPHVYGGLRFTTDDFAALERDRAIDHVHTNGQFDLYLIHAGEGRPTGETFNPIGNPPPS